MYLIKYYYNLCPDANLAQLVEQRIRYAWVECSNHLVGTSFKPEDSLGFFLFGADFFRIVKMLVNGKNAALLH